jgi:hypothetical protein
MELLKWAIAGSAWAVLQVLRFAEEEDLARRLRARDPRVMSALYDRYAELAYSLILSMVRDGPAAEDLVQETFLPVWNRAQSFDADRGALGPWIELRKYSVRMICQHLATAAPYEILSPYADSDRPIHGLSHAVTAARAVLGDLGRFLTLCFRSRAALAAENLFLRKRVV